MGGVRRADDYPFFDNDGLPLAFAHRGGALLESNVGLENSMVAFEAAVALGYRYLETDVTATADGVLLAFHDRSLDRLCDVSGIVAELPYDRVRRARLGGREAIPLLSDLLTAWPDVRLNIDCKTASALEPLAATIEEHQAWDRVCLASFSMRSLGRLRRRLSGRVATSYGKAGIAALRTLPTERLRRLAVGWSGVAAQVPPSWHGIPVLTRGFVARAHELGKHVHVWTIDDPQQMGRLLDLGVDGIFTDRPDVLRNVYQARGLWPGQSS